MIDVLRQDARFAIRQLRRAPAFTAAAMLTLALGIGANTGIFTLIHGFYKPLPVPNADRIVVLAASYPGDESGFKFKLSYPALVDFRTQASSFESIFGVDTRFGGLTAGGRTTQFLYDVVTGNLFTGLGLVPAAGRLFRPGEGESPGAEPVLVLSYSYWQSRFGGSLDLIGQTVQLNGRPARIIGVTPRGFHGVEEGADMQGWLPLGAQRGDLVTSGRIFHDRNLKYLTVLGRLKARTALASAQAEADTIARRLNEQYPASDKDMRVRVMPEPDARPIPLRFLSDRMPLIRFLLLLLAGLVLLLACMNVVNLLLVRATVRQREMAVRSGLGAGRVRLFRLLLVESLLLAALGGLGGVVFGKWASTLFMGTIDLASDIPTNFEFGIDWTVFMYALLLAAVTGIIMGIAPAIPASRPDVTALLHDGGRSDTSSAGRQRVRQALVVAQVGGSLVLLIVAGLFVRSLQAAQRIDLGFDPDHLLNFRIDPGQLGYSKERTEQFYKDLDARLRALPGVDAAATAFSIPMGYYMNGCPLQPDDRPPVELQSQPVIGCNAISPGYFETLRLPLVRGRVFTDRDVKDATHVAIINETLARQMWPNVDPIGRTFVIHNQWQEGTWQIVGIAHDSKYVAVFEDPLPFLYYPMAQDPISLRVVHVRSSLPTPALIANVQHEIAALDPELPVADLKTMRQTLGGGLGFLLFKIGATQAAALGLLGLVLAVVGIYGVVSYSATQRVREIGIRLALGAEPADVRRLILRQGTLLVLAGIGAGLVVAALLTRVTTRFLLLVSTSDPATFAIVTAVLTSAALLACYLPARRAMRVDPVVALRQE